METIKGRQLIVVTSNNSNVEQVMVIDPMETKCILRYAENYKKDEEFDDEWFIKDLHERLESIGYMQCPCEIFEL